MNDLDYSDSTLNNYESDDDWKSQTMVLGGLLGAGLGLISALLYIRSAEQTALERGEKASGPGTRDALTLGVSLLGIIRTITEWGQRSE